METKNRIKKLTMSKTAILLSVCVATALCANIVGACSADDDDIYYGDELKTRAAATANSSGDASVYQLNSPLYTVSKAPFKFSKKMTQYATFSYAIIANDAFNGFNVRVTEGGYGNDDIGSISGRVQSVTANGSGNSSVYTFNLVFTTFLLFDVKKEGTYTTTVSVARSKFH